MTRRLLTRTYAARAASRLEHGAKLAEALALPQLPDIVDTLDGPRPLHAFILGPFQTLKSLIGQLHLQRNMLVRPGPALWYAPSDDFGKEFADLKFNPLFDAQPPLTALLYSAKNKRAKLRYSIAGGSSLLILSAKTDNDRHGKTARDLYLDEVHTYESGWIKQIRNRHGAYPDDYLELLMSTGLMAGTEADLEWQRTDQRTWHMRCANPACHRLILPRYAHHDDPADPKKVTGGLRYERAFLPNGLPDEARIAATLVHECPHCHHTLPDTRDSRLALNGTAAAPRGLYVIGNKSAAARIHGWTFHGITCRPWFNIVLRFELAQLARQRGDLVPLSEWVREECAGIWNPTDYLSEKILRRPSGYKMLEAWPEEGRDAQGRLLRFCDVDVQLDHFVVTIRKWNQQPRTRLHYAEKVTTAAHVDELCQLHAVPKERVFLDSRHKPQFVRRLCARYGWRSVMGDPAQRDYPHPVLDPKTRKVIGRIRRIYSEPISLDPFQGLAEQGRAAILEWHFSKHAALERLHLLRTLETNDGTPIWTDADDAPPWYRQEIDAFHRVPKRGANGETYYEYQAHGPDHAADTEAIGIVAASIAGLVGSESLDPQPKPETTEEKATP